MTLQCDTWLTPKMTEYIESMCAFKAKGLVHSVFDSVANIAFTPPDRETQRLLTLVGGDQFRLPDSIRVPVGIIRRIELGMQMPVFKTAYGFVLKIRGYELFLNIQTDWTGRLTDQSKGMFSIRREHVHMAAEALASVPNGFGRLPESLRVRARKALLTADAPSFLGLGAGLTPAFDDACIGTMACCKAFGFPLPFQLMDVYTTTDISARYLNLAKEDYFGEPLCMVMNAWRGNGNVKTALDYLLCVGATSGADMLYGALCMAAIQI